MRPLVYGYHGKSNYGDDLFVDVIENFGSSVFDEAEFTLIRSNDVPSGKISQSWRNLTSGQSPIASPVRAVEFLVRAAWSRHIAFCGGSLFSRPSGNYAIAWLLVKLRICTVSAYGVSVGPIGVTGWRRRVLTDLLGACESLVVRDHASLARLSEVLPDKRAVLAGDLAALSKYASPSEFSRASDYAAKPYVLYIPCRALDNGRSKVGSIAAALGSDCVVKVLSVNSNRDKGDDDVADSISAYFRSASIESGSVHYSEIGLEGVSELINGAEFVISARLHGAVAAYLLGRPFILETYHAKCVDFAETVGLDPSRIVTPGCAGNDWREAIESIRGPEDLGVTFDAQEYRQRANDGYLSR